jgi:hypothetical protein
MAARQPETAPAGAEEGDTDMNFFDASEWDSAAAKHAARAEQEYERNDATEEQRRSARDFWLGLSASATETARRLRARLPVPASR